MVPGEGEEVQTTENPLFLRMGILGIASLVDEGGS